jgi:long-chain acyl-CoA synthetase
MPLRPSNDITQIELRLTRRGARFELTDDMHTPGGLAFRHAPKTLAGIYCSSNLMLDYPFLVIGEKTYSYGGVLNRAGRLASALRHRAGVRPGVRVALALENGIDWVTSFLAVTSLGGCAVLVPPLHLSQCLEKPCLDAAMVFTDNDLDMQTSEFHQTRLVDLRTAVVNGTIIDMAYLLGEASDLPLPDDACEPDAPAIIAFTSGSTGLSKGVVISHRALGQGLMNMMLAGALSRAQSAPPSSDEVKRSVRPRPLLISHLSHISGFGQLLLTMMCGSQLLMLPPGGAKAVLETLHTMQATSIIGTPLTQILDLLDPCNRLCTASLRSLTISGDNPNRRQLADLTKILPNLTVGTSYGLTETCGAICALSGREWVQRPNSFGRIVPSVDCRIVGPDGEECHSMDPGNILLRGPMLASSYIDGACTDKDGWFHTGDYGALSVDRHLHLLGRNALALPGGSILTRSLERVLEDIPGIANVAAIPDPAASDCIVILYTSTDNNIRIDEGEAHLLLTTQFDLRGMGIRMVRLSSMPLTASGKIDRYGLRKTVAAERSVV